MNRVGLLLSVVLAGGASSLCWAAPATRSLEEFGDISTVEGATAALQKAKAALGKAGGVLVIPPQAPKELIVRNDSQTALDQPGMTIIDYREGSMKVMVAPLGKRQTRTWSGTMIDRELNLGQNSITRGWTTAQAIQNRIISGASSYMAGLTHPVTAGKDRRAYVSLIRGIWVGQHLEVVGRPRSNGEGVTVKRIGWDPERRRNYFVADFQHDHPANATVVYAKHMVTGLTIEGFSNCDNQTAGALNVLQRHYGVGDQFLISGSLQYMSDVMSGYGDEGGVVMTADVIGLVNSFHAKVESVDWSKDQVVYAPGITNAHTLSNSRPLINLNEKKWITAGKVWIVSQAKSFRGKKNRTRVVRDPIPTAYHGGMILAPKGCGWTDDVVGRFFAVTDPSEMILPNERTQGRTPGNRKAKWPVRRWYRILEHAVHKDGMHQIKILRVRWAAVPTGSPNLFDRENYTYDGHERPMSYAIAPGAWVYDISQGWVNSSTTGGAVRKDQSRKLRVVPTGDRGTTFDFEPGDPVEQAVGPDPYQPKPLRLRHFDQMPSTLEGATLAMCQYGRVQVRDGIRFVSLARSVDDLPKRKDKRPPYEYLLKMASLSTVGIDFDADVTDAAILFRQPYGRPQPIRWVQKRSGSSTLAVSPETGTFQFAGGDIDTGGQGIQNVSGLSGGKEAARNLRGIDVPVRKGNNKLSIQFKRPEADAAYAVSVMPTWMTPMCITAKEPTGFVVEFGTPAPDEATADWIIVR